MSSQEQIDRRVAARLQAKEETRHAVTGGRKRRAPALPPKRSNILPVNAMEERKDEDEGVDEFVDEGEGVDEGVGRRHRGDPLYQYNHPKFYCGTKDILPAKYDSFGTPYACLKKGISTGKYLTSDEVVKKLIGLSKLYGVSITNNEGDIKPYWELLEDIEKEAYGGVKFRV